MRSSPENLSRAGVTQLLKAWGQGDEGALAQLAPLVEKELHRLAHKFMRQEKPGQTLQTTALVNEVYVRLIDGQQVTWQNRAHFFAVSARTMRHILTDIARARTYQKRNAGTVQLGWNETLAVAKEHGTDILALDDVLNQLALLDPRKAQVVELRFFGGLNVDETAEVLKVSQQTVLRDWKFAKSWLLRALSERKSP